MLKIKNLSVSLDDKKILKNISLDFKQGVKYAIIGPNGSGKSTLSKIIINSPEYKITSGDIIFNKIRINDMSTEQIAKMGIFYAFQNPIEISGLNILELLKLIYESIQGFNIDIFTFHDLLEKYKKILEFKDELLLRGLNDGFSGGEKKKMEILQMLFFQPKIAFIDEIDSGLDVDALKRVTKGIDYANKNFNTIPVIITHYNRILKYLDVDTVFVLKDGKLVDTGSSKIINEIDKNGFKKYN